MTLDLGTLSKAVYLTFSRRRVTIQRTLFVTVALGAYALLWIATRLGFALDDLFYRSYRAQIVRAPVYIIAPPRSGTTFLHRLMCLDERQFTYFRMYQTLLPAVSLYRLIAFLRSLDRRLSGRLSRAIRRLDQRAFSVWRDIHPTGLNQAEEDEGLFLYSLHTPGFYLLFPFVDEFRSMQFTDSLPFEKRQQLMGHYARCIQSHLYAVGGDRTLLIKNVHSLGRIASILETFPDARFVFVIRSPDRAIPSLINLFYAVWQIHSPDIARDSTETRALAQMGLDYYRYLAEMCERLPAKQFICIAFTDLVQDPTHTVARIYRHLGLEMSDTFHARLQEATRESRPCQSHHRYLLQAYGLAPSVANPELETALLRWCRRPSMLERKPVAAE